MKGFALFLGWALVGLVASYALLYLFTPFGLTIAVVCVAIGSLLTTIGRRAWPEALGMAAGAGTFCWVIATSAANPLAWVTIGAALIVGALVAYAVIVRGHVAT